MPYEKLTELPDSVTDNLPQHAQEIYLAAFNNAWEQYQSKSARQGEDSREEVSHKVAWQAVKQEYRKQGESWQKK